MHVNSLMLTLPDPTLAFVCYYTWVKTHEPWEYDYSIAFHTKLRHNISYTSITIIMKSISQQTQNDIISLLEQGKSVTAGNGLCHMSHLSQLRDGF